MTTDMGPPPPPPRGRSSTYSEIAPSEEPQTKTLYEPAPFKTPMVPPPTPSPSDSVESQFNGTQEPPLKEETVAVEIAAENSTPEQSADSRQEHRPNVAVPYTVPEWSGPPCHRYSLEVLKEGSIIDQLDVYEKGAYMFGRVDLCDFPLEHPTVSRFHAVLQFKSNGDAYLYDIDSTHGTFVNKNQVKKKVFVELHVGDVIRFGQSSRLYILQGPTELMLPESDLKKIRNSKMQEEMQDMTASLSRAKREASLADGISWGMQEDAIEETEDDVDEITWQTYKGQLTEKQEKTREKVVKRLEKIANMKKEIDAIRVKDISQGGLTQGQQTQIARNEQRVSQIMEELENLEETLNESIQESLGARGGRTSYGKKKGAIEDEEYLSDEEDDFYDRTRKKISDRKSGENQSIETADSLLDKKDAISKEIEEKNKLLLEEKDRMLSENEAVNKERKGVGNGEDALDAYMSGLSSQLVVDKTEQLQKELSTLQSEMDRILYLLKIADPAGEAARKRESKAQDPIPNLLSKAPSSASVKQTPLKQNKKIGSEKLLSGSIQKQATAVAPMESSKKLEVGEEVVEEPESKTSVYTVVRPKWLGAAQNSETKETQQEATLDMHESDQFVDYKYRKEVLSNQHTAPVDGLSVIENAAPGLIVRKRKQVEKVNVESKASEQPNFSSARAEITVDDAVALLLKHKRGYSVPEDDEGQTEQDTPLRNQSAKDNKKSKRALGPEKPSFLGSEMDEETWVPPEGQSGDGRTSLNDRFGY